MTACAVVHFAEGAAPAARLADHCRVPVHPVEVHAFPDGESLVRVPACPETVLLYRSLDRPNAKLVEVLFAAAALRDRGARRVILVAPYLAYMRQDMAFHEGEAVSQKVIGSLLAAHFEGVVTVDPHLHRTAALAEVVPGSPAIAASAAPLLATALADGLDPRTVLVGPDVESRQWVESIAAPLGLEVLVGAKRRCGDRSVHCTIPDVERVRGRPAVLVDDCVSSGTTLVECAGLLHAAGAVSCEAIVTHCLAGPADLRSIRQGGVLRLRATDSTASPAGTIELAPVLAAAIGAAGWTARPAHRPS
ncbi:MAG: ribose-phosphate diphosphokinase [Sphingomonadales bacterium]|nr:ribose-phosphate diphosphokinase [Sphingomonadales bacterium]